MEVSCVHGRGGRRGVGGARNGEEVRCDLQRSYGMGSRCVARGEAHESCRCEPPRRCAPPTGFGKPSRGWAQKDLCELRRPAFHRSLRGFLLALVFPYFPGPFFPRPPVPATVPVTLVPRCWQECVGRSSISVSRVPPVTPGPRGSTECVSMLSSRSARSSPAPRCCTCGRFRVRDRFRPRSRPRPRHRPVFGLHPAPVLRAQPGRSR